MDGQAELLGPLLVEEQLLVPEQLELALQFAQSTGLPLDQIVVAEFAVPQPDISRLLARVNGDADGSEQEEAESVGSDSPPVRPLGFRIRRPIGQIFVDLGFITAEDREAALDVQRESGALLGEILIEQGKLTRLELANALSEHWDSATGDDDGTPARSAPAVAVRPPDEAPPALDPAELTGLRRSLDEIEAARVAGAQATEERIAALDQALAALAPSDDEGLRESVAGQLAALALRVDSLANESSDVGALDTRLDAVTESTAQLRSDLDALASRPAEVSVPLPDERVDELKQAVDALTTALDDRLTSLADELRAEATTRTDDISLELLARSDEFTASIAAVGDAVAHIEAEAKRQAGGLEDTVGSLHARFDGLDADRAADLEAIAAARAEAADAAGESLRVEQTLRDEIASATTRLVEATEPDERVDELQQTIDALARTLDDRFASLSSLSSLVDELRADATTRSDEISSELLNRIEELEQARVADIDATRAADAQLHERLDDLDSGRAADLEALQIDELRRTVAALAETVDERLTAVAAQIRAEVATRTEDVSTELRERLDELGAVRDARADERADELAQTIDALAPTFESRLAMVVEELRAETARVEKSRASDAKAAKSMAGELRDRLDELGAQRAADLDAMQAVRAEAALGDAETARVEQSLRAELETIASAQVEAARPDGRVEGLEHTVAALATALDDRLTTLAGELRAETTRVERSRAADAKAARSTGGELREIIDALTANRAADLEAIRAGEARAAHAAEEVARIEQTLLGAVAELAVQIDELQHQLTAPSAAADAPHVSDSEPPTAPLDADAPRGKKKRSKREKGKKKLKR